MASGSSVQVRVATPDDAGVWRALRHAALQEAPFAFGSTYERERSFDEAVYAERLAAGLSVLGLLDGEPVGLGAGYLEGGWFHIVAIWVRPDARRHGVSSAVIRRLIDLADRLDLPVDLEVTLANPAARTAYERLGFVATGRLQRVRAGADGADMEEQMVLPRLVDIEAYYDLVPRAEADTVEVGPFTLFVRTGPGHPYYARPRLGETEFSADDVRAVLAAQRDRGLRPSIEWVDDITPALWEAVEAAGEHATRHPLLVRRDGLDTHVSAAGVEVEVLAADDPRLPDVIGAVDAGFGGTDDVRPGDPGWRARAIRDGRLVKVGAFLDGTAVGGGAISPRGGPIAEVTSIAVLPRARRRGIAASITRALVEAAHEIGCHTLFMSAEDDAAARVYERVGFRRMATACILEVSEPG